MGIEIYPRADVPVRGWLRRRVGRDVLFGEIREAVTAHIDDALLARFLSFEAHEHTLYAMLHPAAPPLEFTWDPGGVISAAIKTSTVGPGFHAFVVELLDAVAGRCGLKWQWAGCDETDYGVTRDYGRLQRTMASHVRSLARSLLHLAQEEAEDLAVNWPINTATPEGAGFAVTLIGPIDRETWRIMAASGDEEMLGTHAESFYPWWRRDRDACFWSNIGLVLAWTAVPWHPPQDEAEANVCELAIACFDRARALDTRIELPSTEIKELRKLLEMGEDGPSIPPRSSGIGFRRGLMRQQTMGAWSVVVPGYFYQDVADDGGQLTYWFADRAIHVSSFSVDAPPDKAPAAPGELLAEVRQESQNGYGETLEFEEAHLAGHATIAHRDQDGERLWYLHGRVFAENSQCLITICFSNASDRQWAVSTFRSVKHPPPNERD